MKTLLLLFSSTLLIALGILNNQDENPNLELFQFDMSNVDKTQIKYGFLYTCEDSARNEDEKKTCEERYPSLHPIESNKDVYFHYVDVVYINTNDISCKFKRANNKLIQLDNECKRETVSTYRNYHSFQMNLCFVGFSKENISLLLDEFVTPSSTEDTFSVENIFADIFHVIQNRHTSINIKNPKLRIYDIFDKQIQYKNEEIDLSLGSYLYLIYDDDFEESSPHFKNKENPDDLKFLKSLTYKEFPLYKAKETVNLSTPIINTDTSSLQAQAQTKENNSLIEETSSSIQQEIQYHFDKIDIGLTNYHKLGFTFAPKQQINIEYAEINPVNSEVKIKAQKIIFGIQKNLNTYTIGEIQGREEFPIPPTHDIISEDQSTLKNYLLETIPYINLEESIVKSVKNDNRKRKLLITSFSMQNKSTKIKVDSAIIELNENYITLIKKLKRENVVEAVMVDDSFKNSKASNLHIIYITIEPNTNRNKLVTKLQANLEELKRDNANYLLFISNDDAPFYTTNKHSTDTLKHINTLNSGFPNLSREKTNLYSFFLEHFGTEKDKFKTYTIHAYVTEKIFNIHWDDFKDDVISELTFHKNIKVDYYYINVNDEQLVENKE